jgi:nicotinamidase-related amidase
MHGETREECLESNIAYRRETWDIEPRESAFILVDFWSTHILVSHRRRFTDITNRIVAPLLPVARAAGFTVIHGPGFTIAKKYPQWQKYADEADRKPVSPPESDWPPAEVRESKSRYRQYARPFFAKALLEVGREYYENRFIMPSVEPQPEDYVIASGAQLHRLLKDLKIVHLFYVGFSTDGCVLNKDYAILAMKKKGYNIILLRDCTTGKETADTIDQLSNTAAAIQQIELYNVSTTSEEFIAACRSISGIET